MLKLAENKATIASLVAKGAGAGKAERAIENAKTLMLLGDQLWEQLSGGARGRGGDAGIQSAVRTVSGQLARIKLQIAKLEAELASC